MFITTWQIATGLLTTSTLAWPTQIPLLQPPSASHSASSLHRIDIAASGWTTEHFLERFPELDIWRASASSIDVVVPTSSELPLATFNTTVLLPDINRAILASLNPPSAENTPHTDIHSLYHSFDSLQAILAMLISDYPQLASKVDMGQSYEGRPIDGIKLSTGTDQPKPQILVLAGQHAREWISISTTLFLAHTLLTELSYPDITRNEVKDIFDSFDFVFVPCVNPDGYVYSWSNDRLWRKSRQPVSERCRGIDLNKNWAHAFATPQQPNPCLDSWPGSTPFEAVELQGLRDYVTDASNHVISFIDLHSFGQMILIPWSSDCNTIVRDYEDLTEAALGAAKRAQDMYGKDFEVGQSCEVNYLSTGEATDWTYGNARIKWSFAINLRDLGAHGFLIPPNQIRPTGEEATESLLSIGSFIRTKIKARGNV